MHTSQTVVAFSSFVNLYINYHTHMGKLRKKKESPYSA